MARTADGMIVVEKGKDGGGSKDNPPIAPIKEETDGQRDVVHFWSTYSDYKVALVGKNVAFKNYVLTLKADDEVVEKIRNLASTYIKEVLSVPFKDEKDLAKFNKFLSELVYKGERGNATRRGFMALQGLFTRSELLKRDAEGDNTPEDLIIHALKTKSFRGGI